MTRTELQKLTENDNCPACNNRGMRRCGTEHMTELNEYGDCRHCDSDQPDLVMCDCQEA